MGRMIYLIIAAIIFVAVATPAASAGYEVAAKDRKNAVNARAAITSTWPKRYWSEAYQVAGCETGGSYDPRAVGGGGLYFGLFQQGSYQRKKYGFGWTALAQAKSAWLAFKDNGFCWTCYDQWPVCGRGLD